MLKLLSAAIFLVVVALTAPIAQGQSGERHQITGIIANQDGSPATDLEELCAWTRIGTTSQGCIQSAKPDPQGHFTFSVPEGTYSLMVRLRGSGMLTYWHGPTNSITNVDHEKTWVAVPGELPLHIHISLPPASVITGTILDAGGAPAANIDVVLCGYDYWNCGSATPTDATGAFTFHVLDGDYFINLRPPGGTQLYYDARAQNNVSLAVAGATRISMRNNDTTLAPIRLPQPANIEFLLPTDIPLLRWGPVSIAICAQDKSWEAQKLCVAWLDWNAQNVESSQTNRLEFPESADGTYYLQVQRADDASPWYYSADGQFTQDPARRVEMTAAELNGLAIALPTFTVEQEYARALNPGWNLVGWTGGLISFDEFCQPQPVTGLYFVHPESIRSHHNYCLPASTSEDQNGVQTGDVLLVYISGPNPQSLRWTTDRWTQMWPTKFDLEAGDQVRVWLGPEGTPLDHIERGLGPGAVVTNLTALLAVNRGSRAPAEPGDVLSMSVLRRTGWVVPNGTSPEIVVSQAGDSGQDRALELAENTRAVVDYFWNALGVAATDIVVRFSQDWEASTGHPLGASGFARRYGLWLGDTNSFLVAHEYYHVLQNRLRSQSAPTWLWEGSAVYNGTWAYIRAAEGPEAEGDFTNSRASWVRDAHRIRTSLRDLEDLNGAYTLGALAAEYLTVRHGGEEAMIHFWRLGSSTAEWETSFEQAFGISTNDFYERFAEYQANGFE